MWNAKYYYNNYKTQNDCLYCGEPSGKYELCKNCYDLSKDEIIIKNDNGKWVKNVRKDNEYKFYDPNKNYYIKFPSLNKKEEEFYRLVKKYLNKKFVITPQVNLQTIIETDTYTRNDELYRNIDFIIFDTKFYTPIIAIELNGRQHYTNEYWIERDKSVKSILDDCGIEFLQIKNEDLGQIHNKFIKNLNNNLKKIYKVVKKEIKELQTKWTNKL